jgi:hypothetical protein
MDINLKDILDFIKALKADEDLKISQLQDSRPLKKYESDDTKDLASALAKAQGEFPSIKENSTNPYFKSTYANLDSVLKPIRPILAKYGLSFTQQTILEDGATILVTRLRHSSGQWIDSITRIIPAKNDIQSYASTMTYMKRYSISTLLGITTSDEDDDGEVAMAEIRDVKAKGVALNTKYNPKEQAQDVITKEQLEELEYELSEYPDIAEMVLDGLKIQSLADMPKQKFIVSLTRIREIKTTRNGQ